MAIAVRIARAATGRDKIAFCGYHGWHDWYLAANLQKENALGAHLLSGLKPEGVPKALSGTALPFRYNKIDELQEIVDQNSASLAAIVMEPIRNEQPKNEFLQQIREISTKIGAVFIFDEISSGFRMCSGGAHLLLNVTPDMAVFSKSIGNGYPISAIIGKSNVMDAVQKTFISSSNWTERVGPTAAIATINKHIKMKAGDHLMKIGQLVQNAWKSIAEKNNMAIKVGGIPPISHFVFEDKDHLTLKALFVQLMLEKGFLASTVFYAMLAHSIENVDYYLNATNEVFHTIEQAKRNNNVEIMLKGKPAAEGFKRLI